MAHTPTPVPDLVDAAEAAELLGVTERWVRRATQERRIPSYRVGAYRRYDPADLAAYVAGCRVPAADEGGGRR